MLSWVSFVISEVPQCLAQVWGFPVSDFMEMMDLHCKRLPFPILSSAERLQDVELKPHSFWLVVWNIFYFPIYWE